MFTVLLVLESSHTDWVYQKVKRKGLELCQEWNVWFHHHHDAYVTGIYSLHPSFSFPFIFTLFLPILFLSYTICNGVRGQWTLFEHAKAAQHKYSSMYSVLDDYPDGDHHHQHDSSDAGKKIYVMQHTMHDDDAVFLLVSSVETLLHVMQECCRWKSRGSLFSFIFWKIHASWESLCLRLKQDSAAATIIWFWKEKSASERWSSSSE